MKKEKIVGQHGGKKLLEIKGVTYFKRIAQKRWKKYWADMKKNNPKLYAAKQRRIRLKKSV